MESLLVRPLIPLSWGIVEGYVVGVIHPWGMGIPCRFVSRSKPTTIEYTGASVSQPPITTYIFHYIEQFDSRGDNLSRQLMTLIHIDRQKR